MNLSRLSPNKNNSTFLQKKKLKQKRFWTSDSLVSVNGEVGRMNRVASIIDAPGGPMGKCMNPCVQLMQNLKVSSSVVFLVFSFFSGFNKTGAREGAELQGPTGIIGLKGPVSKLSHELRFLIQ